MIKFEIVLIKKSNTDEKSATMFFDAELTYKGTTSNESTLMKRIQREQGEGYSIKTVSITSENK